MSRQLVQIIRLLGLSGLLAFAQPAHAEPLFAEALVNGIAAGVVTFERDGARLAVQKAALVGLGLAAPQGPDDALVDLEALPQTSYSFDEARQTVAITAAPAAMQSASYSAAPKHHARPDRPSWGALFNYSYYAVAPSVWNVSASAMGEARLFGPVGVLRSTFVARTDPAAGASHAQRLDTSFAFDDVDAARKLVIGDFVTAGPAWSRSVRAAGFSIGSDFGLRPDLITAPMPRIEGASATPTALDVYVDNVQRFQTQAKAGPFAISDLPMVDGRGRVRLVITDVLGRQSYQSVDFYAASTLLRRGLSSYALEGGFLREDFAAPNDRYTDGFVSFAGRRGLTNWATLETSLVASGAVQTACLALTAKVAEEALVSAAFNVDARGRTQAYVSARRDAKAYTLFASFQQGDAEFRDLASRAGAVSGGRQIQVGGAVSGGWGSLAASYNRQKRGGDDIGLVGLSWSKGVRNLNLFANVFASHGSARRQVFALGFSLPFGRTGSASGSGSHSDDGVRGAVAAQSVPRGDTGWGWRASGEAGGGPANPSRVEAEVRRVDRWGELGLGANVGAGGMSARVYGSGSVVFLDSKPRIAARVGESFGLVDVGEAGVEITVENRPVGKTGADGRFFLAQLPPLVASRVALRPENIALDRQIMVASAEIRPARGSGGVVHLPVRRVRSALLKLVGPDGRPVTLGAEAYLDGVAVNPVGYDGTVYLTDIDDQSQVAIVTPEGVCSAEVPHEASQSIPASDEPVVCRPSDGRRIEPDRNRDGVRHASASIAELHGERGRELRRLRPNRSVASAFARLCRHALHLHIPGLRRAALHNRNPGGRVGNGRRPQDEARDHQRKAELFPA